MWISRAVRTAVLAVMVVCTAFAVSAALTDNVLAGDVAKDVKCKKCVNKKDLDKNAVNSSRVKDNSLRAIDLANDAKIGPVATSEIESRIGGPLVPVTADSVVRSLTISVPGPGAILTTGSLNVEIAASGDDVVCAVDTANTYDNSDGGSIGRQAEASTANHDLPISITRVLPVSEAGDITIFLVCERVGGSGSIVAYNPVVTALFVPNVGTIISDD